LTQVDKATREYWSQLWQHSPRVPEPADAGATYLNELLRQFFGEHLSHVPSGSSLIEVGCGNSAWLPHFAQHHGCRVAGIDYSEAGCESARAILQRECVEGSVYCADVFAPPPELFRRFDVVVSTGVIEHFAETVSIVQAIAKLARPGGLVLTTIPNLAGWLGTVQRRLDRHVYEKHIPLRCEDVRAAHEQAGLMVLRCAYIGTLDFHMCNLNATDVHSAVGQSKRLALHALMALSRVLWWGEKKFGAISPNRLTASGVVCAACLPAR
jgi:cyclopropane fatty-acyl-phospholipid synthase-like methyltransferase